jgi:hypothetical protein
MDFDETRLYYSHQQLQRNQLGGDNDNAERAAGDNDQVDNDNDNSVDLKAVRRHFREFLRKSTLTTTKHEWLICFTMLFTALFVQSGLVSRPSKELFLLDRFF